MIMMMMMMMTEQQQRIQRISREEQPSNTKCNDRKRGGTERFQSSSNQFCGTGRRSGESVFDHLLSSSIPLSQVLTSPASSNNCTATKTNDDNDDNELLLY